MRILVFGATGGTGKEVIRLLREEKEHELFAVIHNEDDRPALEEQGVKVRNGELTVDFRHVLDGIDIVIWAAGGGKDASYEEIDHLAVKRGIDYAKEYGIKKFILLSSLFADRPEKGPFFLRHILQAKAQSDRYLQESGLNYTIIRPSRLTNGAYTGKIYASANSLPNPLSLLLFGISRADVAKTMISCISMKETDRKAFNLHYGNEPIKEALIKL